MENLIQFNFLLTLIICLCCFAPFLLVYLFTPNGLLCPSILKSMVVAATFHSLLFWLLLQSFLMYIKFNLFRFLLDSIFCYILIKLKFRKIVVICICFSYWGLRRDCWLRAEESAIINFLNFPFDYLMAFNLRSHGVDCEWFAAGMGSCCHSISTHCSSLL